jgi:hypothetical protein
VTVERPAASGGVSVVFPRYRPHGRFHVRMSIANTGRLGVTVLGVPRSSLADSPFVPVKVGVSPLSEFGTHLRPLDVEHPVRIEPGEERALTITYRIAARCIGGQPRRFWAERSGVETVTQTIAFRFRYARWFERSQAVRMPLAIALVCRRGSELLSRG